MPGRITHLRRIDGILRARRHDMVHVERDMYGVDVMENVFRGIQLVSDGPEAFSGDVVDLDVHAWLGGRAISSVHIRVLDPEDH